MKYNLVYFVTYVLGLLFFGYIFLFRHVPNVGWDYVANNWWFYVIGLIAGTCIFFLFYMISEIVKILYDE